VSDGAGGEPRFSAPVLVFCSREQISRASVRLSARSRFSPPFGTDSSKTAPGAGGESVTNPCQRDPQGVRGFPSHEYICCPPAASSVAPPPEGSPPLPQRSRLIVQSLCCNVLQVAHKIKQDELKPPGVSELLFLHIPCQLHLNFISNFSLKLQRCFPLPYMDVCW
jgi:hypothetical protein